MKPLIKHLIFIGLIVALAGVGMFYPYLPGKYDALAVPISTLFQVWSGLGLPLLPIGAFWLGYEWRGQYRRKRNLSLSNQSYRFASFALVGVSLVLISVNLLVMLGYSFSLGLLVLALWLFLVFKAWRKIISWKNTESRSMNYCPLYLLLIPLILVFFQAAFAKSASQFSRKYAIDQSQELIQAIERHCSEQGTYPSTLLAVWPDYYPNVVGIESYHYALRGDAYDLYFEQPRFFFDNFGTREFVVYNNLDQQIMPSHTSWILIWSKQQLAANQGWYAVHKAAEKHWKYFWFD